MAKKKFISTNRAPVLTLWAAIVAQRLGFNKKEALTLGRAVTGDKAIEPASVQRYLETKFGDDLETVVAALQMLAKAYKPKELADEAYALYERFRPAIPGGKAGWGAKGNLDLAFIDELAKR